jgi:glyoxalase family protein
MKLEGLHHITAITADAPRNLDFYVNRLGLRFVKKTVNFDQPDAYHLYYADEAGSPGAVLTFFEFPGAARGRAGDGMVHRILFRVGSEAALDFWAERLGADRDGDRVRFADFEGLESEIVLADAPDPPLVARAPGIPEEHALLGFAGVRAFARDPARSAELLGDVLGFAGEGAAWEAAGDERRATLAYDAPPEAPGRQGAGTVHHIAWHSRDDDHAAWRERIASAGFRPTPIIDRQYFHSIYFREPSGVLFEIATTSPGFAVDEPLEHLGEELKLPPQHEPLRAALEERLTPLENPRSAGAAR